MTAEMNIVRRTFLAALALALAGGAGAGEDVVALPDEVIAAGLAEADCDADAENDGRDGPLDVEALGGGLELVAVNCVRAAYNFTQIFFVVDPGVPGSARLLSFEQPGGDGEMTVTRSLFNAYYDPDARTMSESYKGRGVGDCGTVGRWAWNGRGFELKEYWSKPDCDGEPWDFERDDEEAIRRWRVFPKGG